MFVHFLITRFNIIQDWYTRTNRNNANIQTNEWLVERFRLFDTYCFPSVAAQDTHNFTWLVLFNAETPDSFKKKIDDYSAKCPMFKAVYLQPYGDESALIQDEINQVLTDNVTHVITTRLDNDDMIRCDYISMTQNAFDSSFDNVFLDYGEGFQYAEADKMLYKLNNWSESHFCTRVVTKKNRENTVLVDHSRIQEFGECKMMKVINGGGWIEVVHACNAHNRIGGFMPILFADELKDYPHIEISKKRYILGITRWKLWYCQKWITSRVKKHIIGRIKKWIS